MYNMWRYSDIWWLKLAQMDSSLKGNYGVEALKAQYQFT